MILCHPLVYFYLNFLLLFFCLLNASCMYAVRILAYAITFIEPFGFCHNSENEIIFFKESWKRTGWVGVSINCFKSAITRWLDLPLIFQSDSEMSVWQTKLVLEKQRRAHGKEKVEQQNLSVRREKEKVCSSQIVYTVLFNSRFWSGKHVTGILRTQVTKILVHINVYEYKLKCEN